MNKSMSKSLKKNETPWYFGGMAAMCAACVTHPLDTLKVHLQTQQSTKLGFIGMGRTLVTNEGFLALYNGLSASLMRQATYSTSRFGIYETIKTQISEDGKHLSFPKMVFTAGLAGAAGGFIGAPPDLVNVRMQNDIKLPMDQRRNYRHGPHGLYHVVRNEGITSAFRGSTMASMRAVLITIGQLAFYDQFKIILMKYFQPIFPKDNLTVHFTASSMAGVVATIITMPLDVLKTRLMNRQVTQTLKNESVLMVTIKEVAALGPSAWFKGFTPAFIRLGPHTILTFIVLEQFKEVYRKMHK
ncbi:hypothetical protein SNEBB_007082 [Seison nebaliae]|nr:hypothetical protein SNEBB_007082 [Seison nebaliae]